MPKKSKRKPTGVLDYLRSSLPRETLLNLYENKYVCRVVLQSLTSVAQQVVVRLNSTGGSFPETECEKWFTPSVDTIAHELEKWAIILPLKKQEPIQLTPQFAKGLLECLSSLDAAPWNPLSKKELQKLEKETNSKIAAVSPESLERYTQEQWDSVMHFLVGSTSHKAPAQGVVEFLLETNLMQTDPEFKGSKDLVITELGYDFMLQDNQEQVWHFVRQYLNKLETFDSKQKKPSNLVKENLLLLISLSFAKVGDAYLTTSLNEDARVMVKDLASFGLLYTHKLGKNKTLFYPTRAAMQLVGHGKNAALAGGNQLYALSSKTLDDALTNPSPRGSSHIAIIVQTNFQLCAYTTSELHVSMLGLFCDVNTIRRLPNVVMMSITRDSVKSAFSLGIQARQILRFLEKHAHPKVRYPGHLSTTKSNTYRFGVACYQ